MIGVCMVKESKDSKSKKTDIRNFRNKRLFKSDKDKVLSGVFGGVAEYFDVDSTIVRVIAIIFLFLNPAGMILFYLIAAMIIPQSDGTKDTNIINSGSKGDGKLFGILLIAAGGLFLLKNLFSWFNWDYVWPVALIAIGLYMVFR